MPNLPIRHAATPVDAVATVPSGGNEEMIFRSRKLLPVPAEPVKKTFLPDRHDLNTSCCSSFIDSDIFMAPVDGADEVMSSFLAAGTRTMSSAESRSRRRFLANGDGVVVVAKFNNFVFILYLELTCC